MVNGISGNYNRISGLASGIDTESLVEGLTYMERSRIDSAEQQKQILLWKRDYYREIMNKMSDFKNKYLSSAGTFSSLKEYRTTNTGSQYVSVAAGEKAIAGNIVIKDIISLASASKLKSSSTISKQAVININTESLSQLAGKSMNVIVDGTVRTITFSGSVYMTADDVKAELQSKLNAAFGDNSVIVAVNDNTLTINSDGNIIKLCNSGIEGFEASDILEFADGQSNRIDITKPLADTTLEIPISDTFKFEINGVQFSFSSSDSLNNIINTVNSSDADVIMSYSELTDEVTLTSAKTGAGSNISVADIEGNLISSLFGIGEFTEGKNAQIRINTNAGASDPDSLSYMTITKSSNTFEIDSVTYTLTGKAQGTAEENINIGISYNTEAALDTIKAFVSDYNELLKSITDKLSETRYRDYSPLTDEQRAELTETEAEKWDEKANSGLLRNDLVLTNIATELRSAFYSKVSKIGDADSDIGMYITDTGITTGSYSSKGQLKIDEEKLRKALNDNTDAVLKLFTQSSKISYSPYLSTDSKKTRYSESGIFNRISDIIQNNTRVGGNLTDLIGTSDSDFSSLYSKQLINIDKKIVELNEKLTKQENRYWEQFSRMEAALSSLNSTSMWLSSQLNIQS